MARTTRRTTAQRVVGLATMGLPSPIKSVAGSRWGAPMTLMVLGGLIFTGVVTVEWSNGFPSISVDRQRANQVKQALVEEVGTVWDEQTQGPRPANLPYGMGGQPGIPPANAGYSGYSGAYGQGQSNTPWAPVQNWGNNVGGNGTFQPQSPPYNAAPPPAYAPVPPSYYGQPPPANYGPAAAPNYGPAPTAGYPAPSNDSQLSRLREALRWNR